MSGTNTQHGIVAPGSTQQGKCFTYHSKPCAKLKRIGVLPSNSNPGQSMMAATPAIAVASSYSSSNLPELLLQLEAPITWGTDTYDDFQDQNGETPQKANGQPIQDFPWLPTQIPIEPEAFLLEFWGRKHPDCSYADFEIRMRPGLNERLPFRNTLNMRRIREVRLPLNIFCWHQKGERITLTDCLIFESLSLNSVRRNTVLPVKPWGFVKPILPGAPNQAVGLQNTTNLTAPPAPPAPLPLCTFTDGNATHVPSGKLKAIKELTAYLQDTAFERKLAHWIFLKDEEKPAWWNEHRRHRSVNSISVPLLQALPHPARDWIKECIREAGELESGFDGPPISALPRMVQGWVAECLKEGRARGRTQSSNLTVGEEAKTTWSLEVTAPDDSHTSNLSLVPEYPEDEGQDDVGGGENVPDVGDLSSDSSSDSGTSSVQDFIPEISERTEATWEEHWKKHYRGKAVAETLGTGQPDQEDGQR